MAQLTAAQITALNSALGAAHTNSEALARLPYGTFDTQVVDTTLDGLAITIKFQVQGGKHSGAIVKNRIALTERAMGVLKGWELALTGKVSNTPGESVESVVSAVGAKVVITTSPDVKIIDGVKREYTKVRARLPADARGAAIVTGTAPVTSTTGRQPLF